MTVRPIRLFADPVLREHSSEVTEFDRELRLLVRDLEQTLADERGSGLAAVQIGVTLRVFVFHVGPVAGHLVNPVLDLSDDAEQEGPEGCLSMPGLYFDTRRRLNVVARGLDQHGRPTQVVGSGELARCLQHETDHLDGVLFVDRLDEVTRREARRALRQAPWNSGARPRVKVSPHRLTSRIR